MLLVRWLRRIPELLARIPFRVVHGAWSMAIRPWGASLIRPLVEGFGRRPPK
jgi:hypothetical protein